MNRTCIAILTGLSLLCSGAVNHAQSDPLAWLDETLAYQSENGAIVGELSGLFDSEGYYIDRIPPGLLFQNESFYNPRLSLFMDLELGEHLYVFTQARVDRGFDPGSQINDARFDEYFLRYRTGNEDQISLQFGKSATIFGSWVGRHFSWDNPFINAPLAYENVTIITDQAAPGAPGPFLNRRSVPDNKPAWLPVLWGPAYTTGGTLLGQVGKLNYGASIKNNSISSRPKFWDAKHLGWEHPTYTFDAGYTPNAAWHLGSSFSYGAYLLPVAQASLPADTHRGDFNQYTLGWDLKYAHRNIEVWSEVILSRFEVPNVGDADSANYYIETRYKFGSRFYAGLRWNQAFFGTVPDGTGGEQHWDRNAWRVDGALGCRFTRHLQGKVQYSYNHQPGAFQQGEQLVAGQLTMRF
jgi:hypothetical protein